MDTVDKALEYLEMGFSIIPISKNTKRPLIFWQEFQSRLPTEEEVTGWFSTWPKADIALVTGELSGYVVADADNKEAIEAAERFGMVSPVSVTTKRGKHYWFKHPRDGVRRGNRAGSNSRGEDWPKFPGLDFRGDGGYALLPPSNGYQFSVAEGHDIDDAPVWKDWRPVAIDPEAEFSFDALDLSAVSAGARNHESEWDRTEKYIQEYGFKSGKLPTGGGNARNPRVTSYAGEQIWEGFYGPSLRVRCRAFMSHFFEEPLAEREFEDTIRSVEQVHKRNHPEHFSEDGEFVWRPADKKVDDDEKKEKPRRLIVASDASKLIAEGGGGTFLIEPWLRPGSITQIHGYSGSGKTLFLQNALYALASGARYYGPFEIDRPAKVLYFDFELSRSDLGQRLDSMNKLFGDARDNLMIWTPWLDDQEINLRKQQGVNDMVDWIIWARPDVVVIDTIRTAWSGLAENSADEWSKINELAIKLRNRGISVVMLHHSNKPQDSGLGREAGSTNQLTVLETQIRIAQVYKDEDTARQKAGVWDGDYRRSVYDLLSQKLDPDWFLSLVLEVSYGKVREWTDMHDQIQWMGWATHSLTGNQRIVSSTSTKQKAREMRAYGADSVKISQSLSRPLSTVKAWVGEE